MTAEGSLAEGTFKTTGKKVHGNPLLTDEVVVSVSATRKNKEQKHPRYDDYSVEKGSFVAWPAAQLLFKLKKITDDVLLFPWQGVFISCVCCV